MTAWKENLEATAKAIKERNYEHAELAKGVIDLRLDLLTSCSKDWQRRMITNARLIAKCAVFWALTKSPLRTTTFHKEPSTPLEKIYLRNSFDDNGCTIVVDQHGRQLAGIRKVRVDSSYDAARTLKITLLAKDSSGKAILDRKQSISVRPA